MADNEQQDKSKIIVDDDWKTQAQAEKEKLAEEVEAPPEAAAEQRELPAASFSVLVSSLVTQIFFALGAIEDPQTKERYLDLNMAKHHIDILAMLEEKTKGNLDDEEQKMLDRAIYESRMQYVQAAQQASGATPGAAPRA